MSKTIAEILSADNLCFDLSEHPIIRITDGEPANVFLQGQLTVDINDVTQQHSKLGAICNNKARVISIFRLIQHDNDYLLLLPNQYHESLTKHLKKYGVFSHLKFNHDDQFSVHIGVTGKDAFIDNSILPKQVDDAWSNGDIVVIKIPGLIDRYEILATNQEHLNTILSMDALQKETLNLWHAMDFVIGLPHIEETTQAQQTPHHLNLKQFDAISFNKGCYIGQEVIAKMENLSRVNKMAQPALIESNDEINIGDEIFDDNQKRIGNIINCLKLENKYQLVIGIFPTNDNDSRFYDKNKNRIRIVGP